jgi:hypothetical protein
MEEVLSVTSMVYSGYCLVDEVEEIDVDMGRDAVLFHPIQAIFFTFINNATQNVAHM